MITKSPSGALSPYYYKGGYFHGIHYGSYFDDSDALLSIMQQEESFIMNSAEKRRIMIDFYETKLTDALLNDFAAHVDRISSRIIKLSIACDKKSLKRLQRALQNSSLEACQLYYCTDMEEGKTWLVRH